jgi:hypothetical protein
MIESLFLTLFFLMISLTPYLADGKPGDFGTLYQLEILKEDQKCEEIFQKIKNAKNSDFTVLDHEVNSMIDICYQNEIGKYDPKQKIIEIKRSSI